MGYDIDQRDQDTVLEFEKFDKIARLKRTCTITEKIDGTNAQVVFDADGGMLVGSRKRRIYPEGTVTDATGKPIKGTDNFGFARWCYDNREALFEFLGEGRHYGEWAGAGIQRGYNLDHKRFYLFNTARFGPCRQEIPPALDRIGLDTVPTLFNGDFSSTVVDECMDFLHNNGSILNHATRPEGIVVYHTALRTYAKVTFEMDDGKWRHGVKGGDA